MKFTADKEMLLTAFLKEKIGGSLTKIKKRIAKENIYIDGELITEHNPTVPKGAKVEVSAVKQLSNEDISILYEDSELIAVEKPHGILSIQSIKDRDKTLFGKVNSYVIKKSHNREQAFIVHRLDQKVSGVILFAKSHDIQQMLKERWSEFEKSYSAVVEGCPQKESDTLESWLYEGKNFKVFSGEKRAESMLAITHYKIEEKFRRFTLLSIKLGTGKKHQIRVHLSDLGCPIIGDAKYGAKTNPIGRIGLHAEELTITHPKTGKKLSFRSPTPNSFSRLG